MAMSSWKSDWSELQRLLTAAGFTGRWADGMQKPPRFEIDRPASGREVQEIEYQLDALIPESMRRVLLNFSSRVCIEWSLPDHIRLPVEFRQIFAGECRWNLKALPNLHNTHREWIEKCFTA